MKIAKTFYGCEIEIYKSFISHSYADTLYRKLKNETDWVQNDILIFGKKHKIPRLNEWYGPIEMKYSNITFESKPMTHTVDEIREKVEHTTNSSYNSVLINLYRNGNDSMGWHSDNERIYHPKASIASISLGGSRWMHFKRKIRKGLGKKTFKLRLDTGDLIVMKHPTQEILHHSIPKSSTDIDPRINLTFRTVIDQ